MDKRATRGKARAPRRGVRLVPGYDRRRFRSSINLERERSMSFHDLEKAEWSECYLPMERTFLLTPIAP